MYYKRHELQLRFSLYFSASIIAGAFSGVSHWFVVANIQLIVLIVTGVRNCENGWHWRIWWMAMDLYH